MSNGADTKHMTSPIQRSDGSDHIDAQPGVSAEARRELPRRRQSQIIRSIDILVVVVAALAVKFMFDSTDPAFADGSMAALVVAAAAVIMLVKSICVPLALNPRRHRLGVSFAIEGPFYKDGERTRYPADWANGADHGFLKVLDACEMAAVHLDETPFSSPAWPTLERDLYRQLSDANACAHRIIEAQRAGKATADATTTCIKLLRGLTESCGRLRKSGDKAVEKVSEKTAGIDRLIDETIALANELPA